LQVGGGLPISGGGSVGSAGGDPDDQIVEYWNWVKRNPLASLGIGIGALIVWGKVTKSLRRF
jgi:hypothetical protein